MAPAVEASLSHHPGSEPPAVPGRVDPLLATLGDLDARLRGSRILLVDDEAESLRLVEWILRRAGFRELSCTSEPREVPELFRAVRPDLVLLDLQMPEMSGFEVMEELRPLVPAGSRLPVLVVTGDGTVQARQRALAGGARDFVSKPFDPVELVLRIRNLLETLLLHGELQCQNAALEARVEERTAALNEALQRVEEASRAKSKFLAVMSHELRTPLTGIISHAELLGGGVGGGLTEVQQEMVGRIGAAGWHLSHLIQDVLEFANGQISLRHLRMERLDLRDVAREAADLVVPTAGERGLRLDLRLPAEPLELTTDATCVRRILLNLLANAIKFSREGEIVVELRAEPDAVRLRVRDEGIGIAAEHLERIWEPFWQVEEPLTRSVGGVGLGLSIVRSQAELLGGSIEVSSDLGRGSTSPSYSRRILPRPATSQPALDAELLLR
jgi:two-component system, NtrC family, sensor kinase